MENFPLLKKQLPGDKFLNALAEAYRLQEAIIGATELSIISTTVDGTITSFNKAAEQMLGYTADDVIGKTTPLIFHNRDEIERRAEEISIELNKDIKPDFDVFTQKARVTRTAERREWTYIRKDGSHFPVWLSFTALMDERDKLIGYAGIATDITQQKASQAKIKKSEEHLQALVTSLDDIVIEVNSYGHYITRWSQQTEGDSVEITAENHFGNNIIQALDNASAGNFRTIVSRVAKSKNTEIFEYNTKLPSSERWRSAKFSYISSDRVLICISDITEKKHAELELIKSENKFRTLAENIPGIIYLCNNDKTYSMLYLNQKVEEVTGYTEQEFISNKINFVKLFHPDDAGRVIETVDNALQNKESFHFTYRIKHKSGEWRWLEEMGTGVYHNDVLLFIEGFISDITAKRQAEEELKKVAEENYRLFNNAMNLSVIASYDGYLQKINPTWTSVLGWSIEEMISKPIYDFIHPEDLESTREALKTISYGNNLKTFENRYRCKDGTYKWLLWSSASDQKNQLVYASAIDITERKKSEEDLIRSKQNLEIAAEKLQEQNRLLDEFAHIISHNLRSPVGNIQALIGLVNKYSSVEDYQLIFDKLTNVAKNLGDTMNELMETLKVKKSSDVERTDLRFKEILNKVIQSLEGEMINSGATLTFDFNAAPTINFSKAYLESILQNLLSNAIKYSSPNRKPKIHIESKLHDGRVQLTVQDNGLGIDLEKFGNKLFGLHKTFHDHKEAKGVGLFLTKTQIEALGGSISAKSKVDEGTTFTILFDKI